MTVDIVSDSSNQRRYIPERTSTDAFDGKLTEPTLNQVHPRTGCWNKVQMEPWVSFEPRLYAGMLVGAVIIYDQMQVESPRDLSVYSLKKTDEFLMPMMRHAVADHLAIEHAQSCKESGRAVAFVIVRHGSATTPLHR